MTNSGQTRNQTIRTRRRLAGAALALAVVIASVFFATGPAQAQFYSVVYSFTGGADGGQPWEGMVQDAQGNLYGTTSLGGIANGNCSTGCGVVFEIITTGTEKVLYRFTGGVDGFDPQGSLALDAQGNLYGAAWGGGLGWGTVFKVDTMGNFTVLHTFGSQGGDGAHPRGNLVVDAQGNLYGTTQGGGSYGLGSVYKVDSSGDETVLYSFLGGDDGNFPIAGLAQDAQGNLYGTTFYGGTKKDYGTVFKVDPSGNKTLLHAFTGRPSDGLHPAARLLLDAQGNLYGTTQEGGGAYCEVRGYDGCGTAFELDASGQEVGLFEFSWYSTEHGGRIPMSGLVQDAYGNLYGTTPLGGTKAGTVYTTNLGGETVLHSFLPQKGDGGWPTADLVLSPQGNLYGTTLYGGAYGQGTVFALLAPSAATTIALTSAPNPSKYGQMVNFTAVVSGTAGPPPDGETVSFMKRNTVLGTATLQGGLAILSIAGLPVGNNEVRAEYSGDLLFAASTSNLVKQVVQKAGE